MVEKRRKLWGTIVGVVFFIVCMFSLTFAYYAWKSANTNVDVGIHDGGLKYVYKKSASIEGANLSPILDYTDSSYYADSNYGKYLIYSDYTATNTKSDTYMMYAKINIISMSDALKSTGFKWVLLEKVGDSYSKVLKSGNFSNLSVGSNTIYSDIYIEPEEIKEYRFIVYIDGNSSDSSNMQNASIKANLELCDQAVPIYPITLDNQGADSNKGGTSMIYEKYGMGIYKDSTAKTTLMTTSSNGITNPTRTGYTFLGYYTASNGGGVNLIGANSYITSNFTNKYFNKASTLYAKWSINKYNLTINPNGGTYNNSTSTVNVSQNYNTTYGLLPITRTGYTFNKWNLSGSGTLMNGIPDANPSSSGGFTVAKKTDTDGTTYTKYTASVTPTANTWYWMRFPHYNFTAGHTYKITAMIRVNTMSGGNLNLRHACIENDYSSTGRVSTNVDSSAIGKGWIEYSMSRTWTGTTIASSNGNTDVTINPLFEIYTSNLANQTVSMDFDIKNIVITDVTSNSYSYNSGYVYKFGAGNGTLTGNWNVNTYNINYTLNNGTKGTNTPSSGNYDSNITIDNPTKIIKATGDANGTGATIGSATSKPQTFNGWTASNINTSTAKYGDSTSSITNSWSNGSNLVKSKYFKNLNPTNGSTVTLTANWTPVAFNLPTVSKTGYTCNWNTKSDGSGTSYASGASYTPTAVQGNVTLYARCSANKYTVTYDQNYYSDNLWNDSFYPSNYRFHPAENTGSKNNVEDANARSGNVVKFTMNAGTSGGVYYYPSDKLTLGKIYTWSVYVKASSNKKLLIGDEQGGQVNVNVTTSWQRVTHTFTANGNSLKAFVFYLNGSSWDDGDELYVHSLDIREGNQPVTTSSLTYGSTLGDSLKTLTRTGYTFDGWYTAPVGGTKVTSSTTVSATDTTYYAHWTANKVYLDLNLYLDGTGLNSSTATSNGLSVGFRVNNVDNGYVTDYWTQNYYGVPYEIYGVKVDGTNISSYTKSGTVGASNTNVSAEFYNLNFKSNNTNYGTVSASKYIVPKGGTYTTSSNKLTLNDSRSVTATAKSITGYTTSFSNWSPSSGTISAASTVTANFTSTINSYNVNYDCNTNGGSGTIASVKVNYNASVDLTKTCTPKTGYTLVGWNTNKSATSKLDSLKMGTSNITLYAIYKKNVAATFYYYNSGIKNVSSSCDLYNNNTSCSATVPLSTFKDTTSQYGSVYVGYGAVNSMATRVTSTVTLTNSTNYYVAYRKAITEYSSGTSRTVYRNAFFTSSSVMNTVLSTSSTGTSNLSNGNWTNNSVTWTFAGYATSNNTANKSYSSVAAAATSTATSLYSLYTRSVAATFYYYNGSAQATVSASGTQTANYSGSVIGQKTISIPSAVTSSKGPNNSTYKGISTSVSSTISTSIVNTSQTKYYAFYNGTYTASFTKENNNVSSIGSSSLSCSNNSTTNGTNYSTTSCSITLPTITPASGYVASGWYDINDSMVGNAGDSLKLTSSGTYTAKVKIDISAYNVNVTFYDNLLYDLDDVTDVSSAFMKYSVSNGTVTVTANQDDGYGFTNGRVYLKAGTTYEFNCDSDGVWGESNNGSDNVEAFLMLNGEFNTYYWMSSNKSYKFTPTVTGVYWLRLDVNQSGKTHTFSNINISTESTTKTFKYNQAYGTLSTPTTGRSGYSFGGWYTKINDGVKVLATDKVTNMEDHNLYAHWVPTEYTVSYNANGGTGTVSSQTVKTGSSFTVASNSFQKLGYEFLGWTTNSDGSDDGYGWTGWSGTWKYVDGQYGINDSKLVLYARWQKTLNCSSAGSTTTYMGHNWFTLSNDGSTCNLALNETVGNGVAYNNATGTGGGSVYSYISSYSNGRTTLAQDYSSGLITTIDTDSGIAEGMSSGIYWISSESVFNYNSISRYSLTSKHIASGMSNTTDGSFISGVDDNFNSPSNYGSNSYFITSVSNSSTQVTYTKAGYNSWTYNSGAKYSEDWSHWVPQNKSKVSSGSKIYLDLETGNWSSGGGSTYSRNANRIIMRVCETNSNYIYDINFSGVSKTQYHYTNAKTGTDKNYSYPSRSYSYSASTRPHMSGYRDFVFAGNTTATTSGTTRTYDYFNASNCKSFTKYQLTDVSYNISYRPHIKVKIVN